MGLYLGLYFLRTLCKILPNLQFSLGQQLLMSLVMFRPFRARKYKKDPGWSQGLFVFKFV